MQTIQLVHNPTAGDENHDKEHLIEQIERAGFVCRYSSTKEDSWKEMKEGADMIVIAGGDGTVRKVVKNVLKQKGENKAIPIGLLALGTANNISKTFNVDPDTEKVVESWKTAGIKQVDIGLVENVPDVDFFLEGLGFGIFPYLMKEMKKAKQEYSSPQEELKAAQKMMHRILMDYQPRQCHLEIDGTDHSGKFFMVEVMNIRSIGPNMVLAPMADPGDGEFEIVLVPEAHKEKFSQYLLDKLTDDDEGYHFQTLKGKDIVIRWDGTRIHADDKMLKLDKQVEVHIKLKQGALQFLVSKDEPANR
jgi:diacylglycerol kinase (ATP)